MITLRPLTPDDWPLWREVRLAALADAPRAFGSRFADWQGENDREERWRERLALPGARTLVAEWEGAPVGVAGGVPIPGAEGVVELVSMWVAGSARGRGVGDRLITTVEQWAREEHDAVALRLAVAPDNPYAAALYRRHGFRRTDLPGNTLPDGRVEHLMEKPLTSLD
ncbi:GNAT family N-acetyltransferase [Streptomyces sp. ST2-7A]|uniref:GNAT family N-acetyltransferase n=1 Tax=Streptomyces sp. ST2-7A TaxID=2907214 RepID=UPI001F322457|nr:GNAT family N-acetyltransferase [Streptomyces sp. ST2-7A]MCE7079083.1 GNAT family N-acetyltransferase [Streptomyces sp. ST2-7A]